MHKKHILVKVLSVGLIIILMSLYAEIYAQHGSVRYDSRYQRDRDHRYPQHNFPQHNVPQHNFPRYTPPVYPRHRYGTVFKTISSNFQIKVFGGSQYYYGQGNYYTRNPSLGYIVVAPPVTEVVQTLPSPSYATIYVNGQPYYYDDGVFYFYNSATNSYTVVTAPIGAVIPTLPFGCSTIYMDGRQYYARDNVLYQTVYQDGNIAYMVVRSNFGQ